MGNAWIKRKRRKAFLRAARENDVDAILKLHEEEDIRDMDAGGPIVEAARNGNLDVLKVLVKLGVDITTKTPPGDRDATPLHAAARKGYVEIIEFLVKHGVDVDLTDTHQETALFEACRFPRVDVVKMLIRHGANVNRLAEWKHCPLFNAASSGNTEIVNILIQNGANVNHLNCDCQSALESAVEGGSLDVVNALIRGGANVNHFNMYRWGPIHLAADEERADIALALIRNGCDSDQYRISMILSAIETRKYGFILKLVCYGVDFGEGRVPSCIKPITLKIRHEQRLRRNGKPFKCVLTAPEKKYMYDLAFVFTIRLRGISLKAFRQVRQYIIMENLVMAPGFVNHKMAIWKHVQLWENEEGHNFSPLIPSFD